MALSAISGTGNQETTQSPQEAGAATGNSTTSGSGVQPGTTNSLLEGLAGASDKSQGGIPLGVAKVNTVELGTVQTKTVTVPAPPQHHVNVGLFGISALFFVIAVALFWFTARSEKSTTV